MSNAVVPSAVRERKLEQWITQYADTILRTLEMNRSTVHKQLMKAQELLRGRLTGRDIDGQ